MEGYVGLGGWLHTEINDGHRELSPDTVTHFSTPTKHNGRAVLFAVAEFLVVYSIYIVFHGAAEPLLRSAL